MQIQIVPVLTLGSMPTLKKGKNEAVYFAIRPLSLLENLVMFFGAYVASEAGLFADGADGEGFEARVGG